MMVSKLRVFVGILLILYLVVGVVIYLLQERLIFLPEKLPADYSFGFDAEFEEHFIQMDDGAKVNALHFTQKESKGLIVYFHGNAGNLARWGEIVMPFITMGYEVLILDYRGYGKSSGKRSERHMLSDADVIYNFAKKIEPETRIILYGRSIGSAFASYLAGKHSPSKLILETPFFSLKDVAKGVIPIYPTSLLLRYRFENHAYLKTTKTPIFIFHGTDDEIVSYHSGKALFESTSPDKAKLITIQGGHHNDLSTFPEYWNELETVLEDE